VHRLDLIASLAARLGTSMWNVSFLVATGRDFRKLYNISRIAPFEDPRCVYQPCAKTAGVRQEA
jgi:hypothetical protein